MKVSDLIISLDQLGSKFFGIIETKKSDCAEFVPHAIHHKYIEIMVQKDYGREGELSRRMQDHKKLVLLKISFENI